MRARVGLLAAILLAGLWGAVPAKADNRLQGAGATFPDLIYQRWVVEYQKLHPDVKIDYQAIGSGGGIKGITEMTVNFAGSDAPMSKSEIAKAEKVGGPIVEVPSVAGAVVLAYNLPGLKDDLNLDGPTVADIYLGAITNWNDPKIAAMNPGVALPNTPITTAHRTDGSGTNYVFTNYLCTQSDDFKEKVGSGKSVQWPNGQGGAQNAGVTNIVKTTEGAIGYIELAFALQNKIPFAMLKNKDGKFVKASTDSVSAAGEGALGDMDKTLAVNIWNQSGPDAYPISSFTYLIVYKDLKYIKDAGKAKALVDFLSWALGPEGEKLAPELNYAPLSSGVQKKVSDALGTLTFDDKPVK